MTEHTRPWSIPGSANEPILGNTHAPPPEPGNPRGVVIIAHGFKGYKDYGMFPAIAYAFASAGFIAHRFNFSHSGMTNEIETFARPELFEQDTWKKQVYDLEQVFSEVTAGSLRDPGNRRAAQHPSPSGRGAGGEGSSSSSLPIIVLGHSRGGMSALLWAGRRAGDANVTQPAGIITLSAPARPFMVAPEEQKLMMKQGYIESPSSRTGQSLRVGKLYIEEQLADPEGHDVLKQTARIRCPLLIIHGEVDPTVPASSAQALADAAQNAETLIVPAGDHVFNTPNPFPMDGERSSHLEAMLEAAIDFAKRVVIESQS